MSQRIVLASNNKGKVREVNELLANLDFEVIPQAEYSVPDADETGLTFVENAIIKARHAAMITHHPVIADDSGLEVDALNGAPGIYSSRFSGENSSDKKNIEKLLAELDGRSEAERSARFQCVMVYMRHEQDPTPVICQGTWEGRILFEPSGNNGFGYDPVFFVPSHNCSAAQLDSEVKNGLSHRGQALQQLTARLQSI